MLALAASALATLSIVACSSNDNNAQKETPLLSIGQPTAFDCKGDDCTATITIEKAQVGNTCEELGAEYLEWDAVTTNGVLRPMTQDSDCLWEGSTNTEVGGTSVQPGTEKLWSQAFLLPADATAIRVVDSFNGDMWELPL